MAVSRALASMPVLAELCLPYVKPGGLFLAMKSNKTDEEIDAARAIIQTLGGRGPLRHGLSAPGDGDLPPGGDGVQKPPHPQGLPPEVSKIKEAKI